MPHAFLIKKKPHTLEFQTLKVVSEVDSVCGLSKKQIYCSYIGRTTPFANDKISVFSC